MLVIATVRRGSYLIDSSIGLPLFSKTVFDLTITNNHGIFISSFKTIYSV